MDKKPRVGIGVIVKKDNLVLMGKRKSPLGTGTWSFPGGRLEFNEDIETCAKREVSEETGINIKNLEFGPVTNDIFKEMGEHYITLFIISDYDSGEVKLKEPEKCERWQWFEWDKLPKPLFLPIINLLKLNYNPFKQSK